MSVSIYPVPLSGIQETLVDAKGDIVAATGSDAVARLAVGANDTVLTADSSTATGLKWAAVGGGGKVLQVVQATTTTITTITSTTMTDTGLSATITPSSASSKILVMTNQVMHYRREGNQLYVSAQLLRGATVVHDKKEVNYIAANAFSSSVPFQMYDQCILCYLDSPSSTSALTYKTQARLQTTADNASVKFQEANSESTIILMEIGA